MYQGIVQVEDLCEKVECTLNLYTHTRTHARTHTHTHAHTRTHTHTHRNDGRDCFIRIMFRDGLCGFSEPLLFSSVVDLIEYHSLAAYNSKLDITLQRPLSRFEVEVICGKMGSQWCHNCMRHYFPLLLCAGNRCLHVCLLSRCAFSTLACAYSEYYVV